MLESPLDFTQGEAGVEGNSEMGGRKLLSITANILNISFRAYDNYAKQCLNRLHIIYSPISL